MEEGGMHNGGRGYVEWRKEVCRIEDGGIYNGGRGI